MKINETVLNILAKCKMEGNTLFLPEGQLDRAVYNEVNKVLTALGGKWNRKAKGHVFDYDPEEALETAIMTGEVVDKKKLFQFFETPNEVAKKLCELAEIKEQSNVLEPSVGKGRIADAAYEFNPHKIIGLDINTELEQYLKDKPYQTFLGVDFLEYETDEKFDRIIMNPPFTKHQDIKHVMKAYEILAEGGILVSIMSVAPFFREDKISTEFRTFIDEHGTVVDNLPEGTFKESGTMVRTCIVKISK